MPLEQLFRIANLAALLGWAALILLPRSAWRDRVLLTGIVGTLCAAYATLVAVHLVPSGGDFASLDGVRRLFASPPVLLAGWLHYLAFDLFVGCWMAQRFDARGLSRWLQAPLLASTFMVGPVGLLLAGAVLAATRARHSSQRVPGERPAGSSA